MANFDFYGMFDYQTGDSDTYKYTSEEWANYIRCMCGTGVVNGYLNGLACTANGLTITVASGACFINGRLGLNTASKTLTLQASGSSSSRTYTIVAQLNVANRIITLDALETTTLTQNDSVYQMPLYRAVVNQSTTTLTDMRQLMYNPATIATEIETLANRNITDFGGTVSIAKGGTGANTAAQALTNLGAAAASHTHSANDITSTIPIGKGGTGATTASQALSNLGVIYSATQPTYQAGAIWLKPAN